MDDTAKKRCNVCESTTRSRSTHRDCPYNKKNDNCTSPGTVDTNQTSTVYTGVCTQNMESVPLTAAVSVLQQSSEREETEVGEDSDDLLSEEELNLDMFDDQITSGCTFWLQKARSKTCNSRQHHRVKPLFKPGDNVCLHNRANHICCGVVEFNLKSARSIYRLCCKTGVLKGLHQEADLTLLNEDIT